MLLDLISKVSSESDHMITEKNPRSFIHYFQMVPKTQNPTFSLKQVNIKRNSKGPNSKVINFPTYQISWPNFPLRNNLVTQTNLQYFYSILTKLSKIWHVVLSIVLCYRTRTDCLRVGMGKNMLQVLASPNPTTNSLNAKLKEIPPKLTRQSVESLLVGSWLLEMYLSPEHWTTKFLNVLLL